MLNENNTRNKTDGSVVIEIADEQNSNLPTTPKPVQIPQKQIRSGQIYTSPARHGDEAAFRTPFYQAQNVGSQPVYYQVTRDENTSRRPMYIQRDESDDNFQSQFIFMESFDEQEIRSKFIKRVYAILSVQLVFTCAFVSICIFETNVREYVKGDIIGVSVAAGVELIVYFLLICYEELRRSYPINFILLAILTVAFAYITGAVSLMYSTQVVMLSLGITGAICLTISITACQTSFDVTSCMPFLCLVVCISMVFVTILMIVQIFLRLKAIDIIISGIIGLVFCLYLMFDTQMIMGGRRIQLSPEEYIFGALTLYVDIIQILWTIMKIFGECK